jgi:diguanylate cyclase (GGDEF)-like protein
MMAQGEALGILHIQGGRDAQGRPEGLEDSKQQLAMTLAEQIGLALANLKLRETLRVQSIRDPLTGMYNRRYMEESLERELRRAARNYRPLGAIMLDLDHFKRYNDTFGHDAGDSVLREFGNFLQTRVREEDIACRFGGEEFVLILPDASLEVTRQRADQLREGVKRLQLQHRGQGLGPVTASLGVAVFPEHGANSDDLFRAADEALFQAKAQGRDRVVIGKPTQQVPETVS